MAKISKVTTWTELGCTNAQAAARFFDPYTAALIRKFQKDQKTSIDRMKSTQIAALSKLIGHDGNTLRDVLGHERRLSVSKIGTPAYLNMSGKVRGRATTGSIAKRHGLSVEWLPISEIQVDRRYQRALKGKIGAYTKAWDWRACGAITVSVREGEYWVIDGLQRLSAAEKAGETHILCVLVECTGMDDEAEVFCKCNIDRTQMSSLEKFWAGVEAGNKEYCNVRRIVETHDFCIKRPGHQQDGCVLGTITSVAKLLQAEKDGVLEQVMDVLSQAVTNKNRKHLLSAFYIGGIGYLIEKNRDVDLYKMANKLACPKLDYEKLTNNAKELNSRSQSIGLGGGGSKYFAQAIAALFDKKLARDLA